MRPLLFLVFFFNFYFKLAIACLPTQTVEGEFDVITTQLLTTTTTSTTTTTITTTTTTTTTPTTTTTISVTTTTTEAPYPCSVCPKIYADGCLGGSVADVCATAAQVGISYTLGVLTGYSYGDANTCSTIFSCPLGTTSKVKLPLTGYIVPGPSLVIATCQETGANAGTWYYGIPPLSTPVEIVGTTCDGIISG